MKKATVINTLKRKIKENKFKFTAQREIILQVFLESKERHLSAEDVYAKVRENYPEIGLATIYRSLELFTSLDLLRKLDLGDGRSRYELNDHHLAHSHHHLVCLRCGRILEYSYEFLDAIKEPIQKDMGFDVIDYQLKFYGYCEDCGKENK